MYSEYEIKKQICDIGKRIYNLGFIAANDGNISVKLTANEFLCTPTGLSKGFMTPDMICKIDSTGKVVQSSGNYRPSSEMRMHLGVYRGRPDVNAVVHAHPPYATSFAIAGIPLTEPIMPEAVVSLGCVPIAEYGTPSTEEIPDAVARFLPHYDAVLLENHGALTYSVDLMQAYYKMESLEFYAKLLFISKQLGGPKLLSGEQVHRLYELRRQFGLPGKHPADLCIGKGTCGGGCHSGAASKGKCSDSDGSINSDEVERIIAEVTKKVLNGLSK